MPELGRYGGFSLSTPLHGPRSPSTHTAVAVQQYISYSSTCVGTEFDPAPCRDVHQYMRWYTGTVLGFCFSYDSPPSLGGSDPSPREPLDTPHSPRWSLNPFISPSPQRAVVWGGRGVTVRPRQAGCNTGFATVSWVCYDKNVFKEPL